MQLSLDGLFIYLAYFTHMRTILVIFIKYIKITREKYYVKVKNLGLVHYSAFIYKYKIYIRVYEILTFYLNELFICSNVGCT